MPTLILPYPISTNRYWRTFRGITTKSTEARQYKSAVEAIAMAEGITRPLACAVKVDMSYHPRRPKQYTEGANVRAMDLDNVLKVAIDSLNGIAYVDDKQITHLTIRRGEPIPDGGLVIAWESV